MPKQVHRVFKRNAMLVETMKSHLIDIATFGVLNDDYETFFSQRIKAISDILESKIIMQPVDQVQKILGISDPEQLDNIIELNKEKEKEQASSDTPDEITDEDQVVAEVSTNNNLILKAI